MHLRQQENACATKWQLCIPLLFHGHSLHCFASVRVTKNPPKQPRAPLHSCARPTTMRVRSSLAGPHARATIEVSPQAPGTGGVYDRNPSPDPSPLSQQGGHGRERRSLLVPGVAAATPASPMQPPPSDHTPDTGKTPVFATAPPPEPSNLSLMPRPRLNSLHAVLRLKALHAACG